MAGEHEVGYKRPPKRTQFQKGRSGNPKGRPKGTRNLKSDLAEELQERIFVREGTREMHISKQRAVVKSLMAQAVKGDTRAANLVLQMVLRLLEVDTSREEEELSADEQVILEGYEADILRRKNAPRPSAKPPRRAGTRRPTDGTPPEGGGPCPSTTGGS